MSKNQSDKNLNADLAGENSVVEKWLRMDQGHDDIFRLEDTVIEINIPTHPTRSEHAKILHLGQRIWFELGIGLVQIVRNSSAEKKISIALKLGPESDRRWAKRSLNLAIEMLKSHGVNLSKGI